MEAKYRYLNELISKNKLNFPEVPGEKWVTPYNYQEYREKREELLEPFKDHLLFNETKPFYNHISKGCRICGEGKWSCLFITGICNASCFYCPASQGQDFIPSTQNLEFESAEAYAEYIDYFGFKGVSLSGGEPLMRFEKTISYLKKVREVSPEDIYIWIYTNGILADKDKIKSLSSAGLSEIRFDIGATGYKLDKVALAGKLVNNVTIEIPAVPEKKELIKRLLPEMIKAGVQNLNLHQLRLTAYNLKKLLKHNYRYFADERPVVPESELAALEIMNYAKKNSLDIGINYCSFSFKNRFQQAGYRKIIAGKTGEKLPPVTENGYLRCNSDTSLGYEQITLTDKIPPVIFKSLQLKHKTYFFSRIPAFKVQLNAVKQKNYLSSLNRDYIPDDETLYNIWRMEFIENGLREY